MLQQRVSSVAVFNQATSSFAGFVDVLDVSSLVFLLNLASALAPALASDAPDWDSFGRTELKVLASQKLGDIANLSQRDPFVEIGFHAPVRALLEKLTPSGGARRVVIRDAGNVEIAGIVSQWDAVKWLQRVVTTNHLFPHTAFRHLVPAAVHAARHGRPVVTIAATATAMDAFTRLAEEGVSAAAVVDEEHRLVGVLSASDFLRARHDEELHQWDRFFNDLRLSVGEYLSLRNKYFPGNFSKKPILLEHDDQVLDVLNKYTSNHIHRLFVVDGKGRPIGVWSLGDVIEVFLRYQGIDGSVIKDFENQAKKQQKQLQQQQQKQQKQIPIQFEEIVKRPYPSSGDLNALKKELKSSQERLKKLEKHINNNNSGDSSTDDSSSETDSGYESDDGDDDSTTVSSDSEDKKSKKKKSKPTKVASGSIRSSGGKKKDEKKKTKRRRKEGQKEEQGSEEGQEGEEGEEEQEGSKEGQEKQEMNNKNLLFFFFASFSYQVLCPHNEPKGEPSPHDVFGKIELCPHHKGDSH